ncbi:MAG: ABC transporter ATP-binding protein [Deltaproteobacteria bacterium]|nr:MAG: ABC transporter ATP-binding protein [Deltaproteobacteria bacterium]TMQ25331.1 MAG: ABC transporter ATP-binding protein [Deltaproteobacteria bacterium]
MAGARSSLGYLKPYRRAVGAGVAMMVVTNLCALGVVSHLGQAIQAIKDSRAELMPHIVLLLIGFALATAVTRILSRVWIFNAARAAEYDLRSDLFGHLMTLSPGYYRDHPTGDVMSRLTNDVQTVRAMWGAGAVHLANAVTSFATVLTMMVLLDPVVAVLSIVPYPLIFITGQALSRRIYRTTREVQAELGGLSSRIQEDLGAIQVIKTYGLDQVRRRGFLAASQRLLDKNMAAAKVRVQLGPILNTLAPIGVAILILIGGRAVIHKEISVGYYTEFTALLARLVWPTLTLGFMLALVQRGRASWARLVELQAIRTDIPDGAGPALPASAQPAHVAVRDLTIRIGDRAIVDRVSFELEPGSITAIVGRTGSGKSTLVEALCRLIAVPPGAILLDGHDITAIPLASLRGQIGYAPQEAFLFSTTIADNVAMGYGGGTAIPAARARELERAGALAAAVDLSGEPRVNAAAVAAGLEKDLVVMPDGLATIVGERGITLSGGQRQRVALARALAAMPRLLVLDDSLSSVDAETEQLILGHLRAVMHGRTAVLISHRVAAIKDADQILVLDQGQIVERGSHEALLATGGLYSELYRTQLQTELGVTRKEAV